MFSNKSHRVQNLETDGIQEVSGSISLISTNSQERKRPETIVSGLFVLLNNK